MPTEHTNGAEREQRLATILVACLEAFEGGQPLDRANLVAQHPEFAAELARFFDDQERVDRCAAPLRAVVQGRTPPAAGGEALPGQPPVPTTLGDFRIVR